MGAQEHAMSSIGWRATAGSEDKTILISELQAALQDEISELTIHRDTKKTELYDGHKINKVGKHNLYNFSSDDADDWRNRKPNTEIIVNVNGEELFGHLDSVNGLVINITLDDDKGEFIEEATIQDSSVFLLESLYAKLERVKKSEIQFNLQGSMKLFAFEQPLTPEITPEPLQNNLMFLNSSQQMAVKKAISQEITFIWGPPGTGKTKTLAVLLKALISNNKRVLLVANTNSAVDEILKKFIEDKENAKVLNAGRIVRLGIPSVDDETYKELVCAKSKYTKDESITQELGKQIKTLQETAFNYQKAEPYIKQAEQRTTLEKKLSNLKQEIDSLNDCVGKQNQNLVQESALLTQKFGLLEKAQKTNFLRRALTGMNTDEIKKNIYSLEKKIIEGKQEIITLHERIGIKLEEQAMLTDSLKKSGTAFTPIFGIPDLETLEEKIRYLKKQIEQKQQEIQAIQQKIPGELNTNLAEVLVIATTIARACIDSNIPQLKYDSLIIDEASMAALPNLFYLAGLCQTNYIISGDFRQLSPIAQTKTPSSQKWLKRDIFAQAGIVESVEYNRPDDRLVMLQEQYRMHPSICNLISEEVYCGKLKTPKEIISTKEQLAKLPPFEGKALVFCDTATTNPYIARPKNSYSRISPYSAVVSANIALKCINEAAKKGVKIKIGIVSPYNAQAKLISRILSDKGFDTSQIISSTIHRFQGSERDCIIFDLVEGEPLDPGRLTQGPFKRSEPGRLINVAISRASGKFILVGNSEYITKRFWANDAISLVLEQIRKNGEVIDSSIIDYWYRDENSKLQSKAAINNDFILYDQMNFYQALLEDMKKAKTRIVIFSPFITRKRVSTLIDDFHSISQKGIPIYIITRKSKSEVVDDLLTNDINVIFASKDFGFNEAFDKFHFKLAVIDNSVVYYGSLNILAQYDSAESMMAFRTKKTVSQLVRNFGIDRIIKEYLSINQNHSKASSHQQTSITKDLAKQASDSSAVEQPLFSIQRADIFNPTILAKTFGKIKPGKFVRIDAEDKIWQIGRDLGFRAYTQYEALNLLNDGYRRFISVIWKDNEEIVAAFQVRKKTGALYFAQNPKDKQKLLALKAAERYLVNVSEKTGEAVFIKVSLDQRSYQ